MRECAWFAPAGIEGMFAEKIYPHIYGTLNRDAIVSELPVKRDEDGTFVSLELLKLD